MAEWNVTLPDEAEVGDPKHVEDHNLIVAAISELRANVDEIELTPGPEGPAGSDGSDGADGENPFTESQVTALLALIEDE